MKQEESQEYQHPLPDWLDVTNSICTDDTTCTLIRTALRKAYSEGWEDGYGTGKCT